MQMNRRKFLARLGVGVAVGVAVPIAALAAQPKPTTVMGLPVAPKPPLGEILRPAWYNLEALAEMKVYIHSSRIVRREDSLIGGGYCPEGFIECMVSEREIEEIDSRLKRYLDLHGGYC